MAKINPMRKFIIEKYCKGDPKVQVFYKYQSWRSYTVSTLSSNQIYLSKYHELNDPFDPFLPALKT